MAGAVIENLSNRKLLMIIFFMVLVEVAFLLIGGLVAPHPTHHTGPSKMRTCKERKGSNRLISPWNCNDANIAAMDNSDVSPDSVVFVGMFPPHKPWKLIKWFQYLLCIANIRITFSVHNQVKEDAILTMNLTLAYTDSDLYELERDKKAELWTEFASTRQEERPLTCNFNYSKTKEYHGYEYNCDPLFMFHLGSVAHQRYLLNLKLPLKGLHSTATNRDIGQVSEIELVGISQTGGFTYVWLVLKSVMSVILFVSLFWFWRRVSLLTRKSMLVEKACFVLGLSMIFLDLPLELFTLIFDAPWMLLFTDIRQGLFYVVLFSFWVVFTGEHLMDQANRNKLSAYTCQLFCIFVTSVSLLSFDLAERGIQLTNPFATVWTHPTLGYALLALAGISAAFYFILLLYLVVRVFRSIQYKRRFVLQDERSARFRAVVSRLKTVMLLTLATAGLTIAFFFLEQRMDGMAFELSPVEIQISSAFFTGVYGLWNIYVCTVLFMYAPSHKIYEVAPVEEEEEEEELASLNHNTEQSEIFQATQVKERED